LTLLSPSSAFAPASRTTINAVTTEEATSTPGNAVATLSLRDFSRRYAAILASRRLAGLRGAVDVVAEEGGGEPGGYGRL
jgi:hypothetical protein